MANMTRGIPFEYEPKRNNRFYAEFPDELGIETWKVQKFKRPSIKINSVQVPFMNEMQYVAGRTTFDTVSITLIDTIGPSTSQQVMEWIRLHFESLSGRMGYKAGYAKNIILKSLDPAGVEIDKFLLEQCQIVSVDFGDNDYSNDELLNITIEVQPYRCVLNF